MGGGRGVDAIVVGAGIIGAACAWRLAREGYRVSVVDDCRAGATAAGMGHLVCMDDNPAELALSAYSLRLWREVTGRMPQACAWRGCGTLWLAEQANEMAIAEQKRARLAEQGVAAELLTAEQVAAMEPMLRQGLAGGLRVPGDGILYAPQAARWLLADAGVAIDVVQGEAIALDEAAVRLADGRELAAPVVVLACGLRANDLLSQPLLRAKKGHLAITDRYPPRVRHQLVELGYGASAHASDGASVAFNVQARPTGQWLIGSSRQFDSVDSSLDMPLLAAMLMRAQHFLPTLAQLNIIRCWTGLRAASADGLPLLGAHPRHTWLWLALGHEGLGVTTALGSAALLAAQIGRQAPEIDDSPYLAARAFAAEELSV
ncbi:D-amino-acid oxidase [Serratia marcescens]|jgi:glycine/D-amino acid oxidase-like deaminating enzyme|uniref:FAD-binding oxidoreductase n=3 Tax=Serratia TaxID=613 RepID=A0AAP8PUN8_SERMA|nr:MULTISPECIES: FAD-dependent oxidoreductase [Serratia]KAB5494498.1 FAD-binding oxidoreductase [Enterobacter sp. RJAL6]KLE40288.1 D-amino acid oxidase [Serratia sp. TEL]ALD43090.1 D-amino acid oxidase [Serratia marcescens]ASL92251.1 D-amino-acid oxidase [Serratia marcescens]AUO00361.1 FAD-binding oxidoreductase [Serratia marcescens]